MEAHENDYENDFDDESTKDDFEDTNFGYLVLNQLPRRTEIFETNDAIERDESNTDDADYPSKTVQHEPSVCEFGQPIMTVKYLNNINDCLGADSVEENDNFYLTGIRTSMAFENGSSTKNTTMRINPIEIHFEKMDEDFEAQFPKAEVENRNDDDTYNQPTEDILYDLTLVEFIKDGLKFYNNRTEKTLMTIITSQQIKPPNIENRVAEQTQEQGNDDENDNYMTTHEGTSQIDESLVTATTIHVQPINEINERNYKNYNSTLTHMKNRSKLNWDIKDSYYSNRLNNQIDRTQYYDSSKDDSLLDRDKLYVDRKQTRIKLLNVGLILVITLGLILFGLLLTFFGFKGCKKAPNDIQIRRSINPEPPSSAQIKVNSIENRNATEFKSENRQLLTAHYSKDGNYSRSQIVVSKTAEEFKDQCKMNKNNSIEWYV